MLAFRFFIDTNVAYYTRQLREDTKSTRAKEWVRQLAENHDPVVNLQVLNELSNVLSKAQGSYSD